MKASDAYVSFLKCANRSDHSCESPRGIWQASIVALGVIGAVAGILLALMSCDTVKEFLEHPVIKQEPNMGEYIVFLKSEQPTSCSQPYFVLVGTVADDRSVEMVSLKRMTRPLQSPDVDATMDGNDFRLVSPGIAEGTTSSFELKVALGPDRKQVVVAQVTESRPHCSEE